MSVTVTREKEIKRELIRRELARRNYADFVRYTFPAYFMTPVHQMYAHILDLFAKGKIKKLIISIGPQFGKSELSTRRLPPFFLGRDPNLRISVASYNTTFARKFSRDIQRVIADQPYYNLFPKTTISKTKFSEDSDLTYAKTFDEVEIINAKGSARFVGRGGPLTGNPVDVMIMDDLYKDYAEGNSPVIREAVIDWYTSVVRTRLHNKSQELIVFTRWNEEDLVGYLEKEEEVVELKELSQLENLRQDVWYKINFPSLSTVASVQNELDPRQEEGLSLWPERHSVEKLEKDRALDPEKFESLHQGDPMPRVGLLYSEFKTYIALPEIREIRSYTDVADTGTDYLTAIFYAVGRDNNIYVLDVLHTPEPQEETEPLMVEMIKRNESNVNTIESNSGGRGFARNINKMLKNRYTIETYHQSENKEARIITNAPEVQRKIFMPLNWQGQWPTFARDLMRFKKNFKSNTIKDAADALTGVLEHSGVIEGSALALYTM